MAAADLTLWLAFGAGLLSFISPCCLPLYPSFLSYITGISLSELKEGKGLFRRSAVLHTTFFVIGFSVIFLALGLSATWFGGQFTQNRELVSQLGGILIIVVGLMTMGIFKPSFIMKEVRFQHGKKPMGYVGSVLIGVTYAAGWTPCVGPILTAVVTMGVARPEQAIPYVLAYTLGFAIPFYVMAFFLAKVKWLLKYSNVMMKIGGAMMVAMGVLLYTGYLSKITTVLIRLYGGFTGF